MNIKFSSHANTRMKQERQNGITKRDVIRWANRIPKTPYFRQKCIATSGKRFEIVVSDVKDCRNIITIIGLGKKRK